jgi:glycosyltransferase involved in cell wall biosynthesis
MISSRPSAPGRPLKAAFLFTKVRSGAAISRNHFYGMYELRDHGFETNYLELEQFLPKKICDFLRRHFLTMHFAHLPLFPLFFRYDVVFSSTGYASLVLKGLLRIKKFKWVILDFNILGTIGKRQTVKQKIFAWAVSKADGIVTISDAEKRGLEAMFPNLAGKVAFIREATDMDLFRPTAPDFAAVPLNEDDYILSVGTYGRDFDTLVEAVKGTGIKTIIATKPSCVAHLLPLQKNVTAEFFKSDRMPALYRNAAAVVIGLAPIGEYDSVGTLSLGEAFAMGKVTIVSRTASMESYVEEGKNALFVPLHDASALRTAIAKVLDDAASRERLGAEARAFALRELTLERFAERLSDFLISVSSASK